MFGFGYHKTPPPERARSERHEWNVDAERNVSVRIFRRCGAMIHASHHLTGAMGIAADSGRSVSQTAHGVLLVVVGVGHRWPAKLCGESMHAGHAGAGARLFTREHVHEHEHELRTMCGH